MQLRNPIMHMGRGGPNPGLLELVRVPLTGAAALRQCPLLPDLGYTRSFWEKVLSLMPSREICTKFSNPTNVSRGSATCADPD